MEIINWIMDHLPELLLAVTGTVSVAATIAALTPTPKDDAAVAWVRKVVDWLALNVGHAKNASKAPEKE